ncbi:MAG: amidohydrolase family protein [Candidatus Hydrogenedens sp.]|nr:amidohydrolase family protein [Candidatus Hydrogenedens sp.]
MNTVDVWMQHPTETFVKQPWLASLLRWMGVEEFPALPVDFTLAAMQAAGVGTGLCAAWCGPQGWLITHDDVKGFVAASGGRLKGIASANLYEPMQAVRELRRAVKEDGFIGLRVVPWLWNLPPDDRRYYPLFAECCELGIPFCTQIGHTGPLCPSEPGRPIPYLDHVCLEFPELVVVGGHVGYPWIEEVLSMARKYPNFYVDTSAYKVKRLPAPLVEFMRGRGRTKVMFGTNFPMIAPQAALAGIEELGLDVEAAQLFLSDNARRVFKLNLP